MFVFPENKSVKKVTRLFVTIIFGIIVSGCIFTPRLFKHYSYTEELALFYISENKESIVVLSPKYHYVFVAPVEIITAVESSFSKSIEVRFSEFHLDRENNMQGNVTLELKSDASEEELDAAQLAGYAGARSGLFQSVLIRGVRYAGDVEIESLDQRSLPEKAPIKIVSEYSEAGLAARLILSPITLAVDGTLVIAGTALSLFLLAIIDIAYHPKSH